MAYCIIIRGPLGVGKSSVARHLAKRLKGKYISIDRILAKNGLDKVDKKKGCIPAENFIKAAETIIPEIKPLLRKGMPVIFDGNFYHKKQISHLEKSLRCKIYIFTLKAPLDVCVKRDAKRKRPYGKAAAKAVYNLVSKFDCGKAINTEKKTSEEVAKTILSMLPKPETKNKFRKN